MKTFSHDPQNRDAALMGKLKHSAPTILVVDDDPHLVTLLEHALEESGYRTISGFDGQMAIQLATQFRPDLVLMDIDMPMTHGLKALEYMRQHPSLKETPILFLTGRDEEHVAPTLSKHTRVGYLKKPVDLDLLRSILSRVFPTH